MALAQKHPWNVLVFPAASEIGLEINRALRDSKEVILHGAGQSGPSAADFHFSRLHALPAIYDSACLPALQQLVLSEKIDAIFPAYDDVVVWLAENAGQIGAEILTAGPDVCRLCRNKRATYAKLAGKLPVPHVFDPQNDAISFPVFVKPEEGQGSIRARTLSDQAALTAALAAEPDLLVMENLTGPEYTIDCFTQRGKGVLFARARTRAQTSAGISTLSEAAPQIPAREWAEKINDLLPMQGVWFFQLKEDAQGTLKLLEIAPRVAGSMALSRVCGPSFPLLALYEAAGFDLTIHAFEADLVMGRSPEPAFLHRDPVQAVYVDLDNALIANGKVHARLAGLLFQLRNRGATLCLLTKKADDLDAALTHHRLSGLFDRIERLPADPAFSKANAIKEKHAILIDDSFHERRLVALDKPEVRCFDAAGALCLWEERI